MRDTAEFDVKDFDDPDSTKGVYAKFYFVPKEDAAKSKEAGRPVFVDKEYIEIIAAGNQNNIVKRPVTEMDIRRFRKQYEQFKAGDSEQLQGTPLGEIPWITRSQVEDLAYRKIRTLEQLAEVSDHACTELAGLFELKRKAAAWLKKSEEAKPFTEMHAQIKSMQETIAALQAQLAGKKGKNANEG